MNKYLREVSIRERRFYLALQDGRLDDKTYPTKKEAKKALAALSSFEQKGTCIMKEWITL